jgi:hypothetical protein
VIRSRSKNKPIIFIVTTVIVLLALYLLASFNDQLHELLRAQMGGLGSRADTVVDVIIG